ncbi:cystathionine gamma-synthase [Candidatus Desantisbacteria bacterium CG_4_10_14_0_8_um_filter_48_22]|uniref:Cystathionine gamma-synthase n=1 Tax=Candidatus Desantisbacteria bacterium CG_4_10_14_0_8_um_filter_48_22 TaxID=1974543 RepID=A0A2M7SEP1_9BACT|nr:MAG: cystathionine gamma-synthase [Candidatus Desantisbacteria bacterium CG1_02_49_89]PIV55588.1 MAG: cystathionine gamma-synthase [Candidatus Desantisbacteria bacterium CG02_land_8_20_14_3_00_49_13]PIZ17944.1 MAG: cystathionine gamma-synthase [Candidatus Desantisbacteria bacterium CG_4_10_14_0_8_um_filter_48_22]PJB27438.1 MAG: cystathionine gamma-synthase [Candidatus Desantisbacteria bacterium CG_4_9_14_3_um_filter_50_7]
MRFETRAIHSGQDPDSATGAVIVPVYQTSTYRQDAIGKHKGYEYSRTGNPTRKALEDALASLEGGKHGLAFASGLAATTAVFSILKKGDHVIAGDDIYGGTYRLLEKVFRRWGLEVTYADADDGDAFQGAVQENTKLIWIETPTNPLLKIVDVKKLSEITKKENIILAVDNTFATPYFQRPLELGADIVVHSTTKYLSGHSDIIGGAAITSRQDIYIDLKFYQNAAGAVPGPWDSWLALRGIKTLSVRMREHEGNALYLAGYLSGHPRVERVYYPGLPGHSRHKLAKEQMSGFGGMISFELKGGFPEVEKFVSRLKIFLLAESLGGVESLVCYPPKMTHSSFSAEERAKRGIKDNLIRLSVGIEHKDDLKDDLEQALG